MRSSSAGSANALRPPFTSRFPLRLQVESVSLPSRKSEKFLNGPNSPLSWPSSAVASSSLVNECATRTCNPPSSVTPTSDTFQPAFLASSKLRSCAMLGTRATTSASTVVTTASVPVPFGSTLSVTTESTRHALSSTTAKSVVTESAIRRAKALCRECKITRWQLVCRRRRLQVRSLLVAGSPQPL